MSDETRLPQETDSLGSNAWIKYLNRKELLDVWSPPENSAYLKFIRTKTINSVEFVGSRLKPRFSKGDEKSVLELENLNIYGHIDRRKEDI